MNRVGPFTTYSHETFAKNDTRETGLHIKGEEWYALIDLKDFKDVGGKFTSPSQFLFQENKEGIRLSVFAEQIHGVSDSDSCLNYYVPKKDQKKLGNKTVGIKGSSIITSIYYHSYYQGYCFTFHFSANDKNGINRVGEIIDSIRFIEGAFSNVTFNTFIYYRDKRVQLSIPDSYQVSYDSGTNSSMPIIKLYHGDESKFKITMTIYPCKNGLPFSKERVKKNVLGQLDEVSKAAVEYPKLLEISKPSTTTYYYFAEDKNYSPTAQNDYRFLCQGHALSNGSVLYFSIVYQEGEQKALEQGLEIVSGAQFTDL